MRLLFAAMILVCGAAQAEVTVLTTGAFKAVAVAVAAPFEAEVGQPVQILVIHGQRAAAVIGDRSAFCVERCDRRRVGDRVWRPMD